MKSKKKNIPKKFVKAEEESLQEFVENLSKVGKNWYLWKNVLFSEDFMFDRRDDKDFREEEVKERIKEILNGNFEDVKEKINFRDDFLYGTYVYTFPSSTVKLLFVIYFRETKPNSEDMEEVLEFLQLSSSMDKLSDSTDKFFKRNYKKNLGLEFDKLGLVEKSGIFFDRIKEENSKKIVYPILHKIPKKSKLAVEVQVMGEMETQAFDKEKWKPGDTEEAINLSILKKKDLDYDQVFHQPTLFDEFSPSDREKYLINSKENLIISGRPGTGKTFMLVAQKSLVYLNYFIEESKEELKEVDWDYIMWSMRRDRGQSSPGKYYKIVMTSLSQTLCFKSEEMFRKILVNLRINHEPLEINRLYNLSSFRNNTHYPLFVNFRKLMFLIDGSIEFQFFDRPINNQLEKTENDCDIKFSDNVTYKCKFNFKDDFDANNFFFRSQSAFQRTFKEINHKHFIKKFGREISDCPILNKGVKIGAEEVYSQIISIIKGSLVSYLGAGNGITRRQYLKIGEKLTMLNEEQKNQIYDLFIKYERWKSQNNYFDFQDVVNHLIRQVIIELVPLNIKLIDVLFIDEVQDFSINQIYLMQLVSRNIKVLAGDTCQTISKVNCFRFCDLSSIYYFLNESGFDFNNPKHIQICLNYRCNSKVLKFAHLFFQIIFYFFQNTLDKVRLDFSIRINGQKPFIIEKFSEFYTNFFVREREWRQWLLSKHCFICKNEEKKRELEEILNRTYWNRNYYVLSIEESKGLEFEVVILYNLFNDMDEESLKKLLSIFENSKMTKTKNPYEKIFLDELEKEKTSQEQIDEILKEFEDYYEFKYSKFIQKSDLHYFFPLCSELKQFYVAITRSKNILAIYEGGRGKVILNRIANGTDLLEKNEDGGPERSLSTFLTVNSLNLIPERINAEANEAFRNERYERAMYLYRIIGNHTMESKAEIMYRFNKMELSNNFEEKECKVLYDQCIRDNIDEQDIIGKLLLKLKENEKALEYFEAKGNLKQCGNILMEMNDYPNSFEKAFENYKKANEYSLAIEALSKGEKYEEIFNFIEEIKGKINIEHYISYYQKYANKYLSTLVEKFNIKTNFRNTASIKPLKRGFKEEFLKFFKISFYEFDIDKNEGNLTMISSLNEEERKKTITGVDSFPYHDKENKRKKKKIYLYCSDKHSDSEYYFKVQPEYNIKKPEQTEKNIKKCNLLFRFAFNFIKECRRKCDKTSDDILDFIHDNEKKVKVDLPLEAKPFPKDIPIFNLALKDWKVGPSIFELYQVKIYKQRILTYMINKMNNQSDFSPFGIKGTPSEEDNVVKGIVSIARTIPTTEDKVINYVLALLVPIGYTENILPLLSKDKFILFLALLRKKKLFFKALNQEKISFKFPNPELKENYYFLFNAFLSICVCSCLELTRKKYFEILPQFNDEKTIFLLALLKPYPRLSSIISEMLSKNKPDENNNLMSLQKYIIRFKALLEKINKDENSLSFSEMMEAIEIGNTISLLIVTKGMKASATDIPFKEGYQEKFEFVLQLAYELGEALKGINTENFNSLIVVFSVYGAIGVLPFPNLGVFTYFTMYSLCLLNRKSILLWEEEAKIFLNEKLETSGKFDVQGRNFLITKTEALKGFCRYLSSFISKLRLKFKSNEGIYYSLPFSRDNSTIKKSVQIFFNRQAEKRLSSIFSDNVILNIFRRTLIKQVALIEEEEEEGKTNRSTNPQKKNTTTDQKNAPPKEVVYENEDEYERYIEPFCDEGRFSCAPFAIFLGSLPSKIELSDVTLEKQETDKIFNFFVFLYSQLFRANLRKTFKNKEFNRIFSNYLLFVNLINKFGQLKVRDKKNEIEFLTMFKEIEKNNLTEDQKCFVEDAEGYYRSCLAGFSFPHALRLLLPTLKPSKILTIIWLKKMYFFFYYALKEYFGDDNYKLFDYNRTYLNVTQLELELEEWDWKNDIFKYFEILEKFIIYAKEKKEDNSRAWLYMYFELEIFVILCSVLTFNPEKLEDKKKEFGQEVFGMFNQVCSIYYSKRNPLPKEEKYVFHFGYFIHKPDLGQYYTEYLVEDLELKVVETKKGRKVSPETYYVDYKLFGLSHVNKNKISSNYYLEENEMNELYCLLFDIENFPEGIRKKERFASILEKMFPVISV